MSGQRSLESASSVPKQVGTVVCGPQLLTRICDQTDNGELCLGAGIALANGHKSQAVIPNQPFAGADPEVAIASFASSSRRSRLEKLLLHPKCRGCGWA